MHALRHGFCILLGAILICFLFPSTLIATSLPTPPNDLCGNAEDILTGQGSPGTLNFCGNDNPITWIVDISEATADDCPVGSVGFPLSYAANFTGNEPGIWYRFTPPSNTEVEITSCNPGTDFDTQIAVFSGPDCNNLDQVAGNDDSFCADDNLSSKVNFFASEFDTYYIYVSGYQGATGTAELTLSCNNPDDECPFLFKGDLKIGDTLMVDFTNATAIGAPKNECSPGQFTDRGRWYRLVGTNEITQISTCNPGTDFDTKIKVFSEGPKPIFGLCGDLNCIAESDDACGSSAEVSFMADFCAEYYIYVYGDEGALGTAELTVICWPPNDLCSQAIPLEMGPLGVQGNTEFATAQDAPVLCNGQTAEAGVWYSFEGTGNEVAFSTCANCRNPRIIVLSPGNCVDDPDFCTDTRISIFEGSCGGPLNCIASNDDDCDKQSALSVCTGLGTTYYIYVDNPSPDKGMFLLKAPFEIPAEVTGLTCPENITITVPPGSTGTVVNYTPPVGEGRCAGEANLVSGLGSGEFFPVGTRTEVYSIIGGDPNTNPQLFICSFDITVVEAVPTMSEWAFFLFGLMIFTLMVVGMYNFRGRRIGIEK